MRPTQHESNNDVLRAPPGATVEECRPLNGGTHAAAESLAKALGASEPIEHRNRELDWPSQSDIREQIAELQSMLTDGGAAAELGMEGEGK